MTDLISEIQQQNERQDQDSEEEDEDEAIETTLPEEINDFEMWAKKQAMKDLSKLQDLTTIPDPENLKQKIATLNDQQRQCFDDICERLISEDPSEPPFYLFISGAAGTGKSHLLRTIIEAIKYLKPNEDGDLRKPAVVVTAPTANAAFIVGGKTIDSAFGFIPTDQHRYTEADPGQLATMKFQYDAVKVYVIDEISMCGASKLMKISYRLQEMADGEDKQKFMGGKSMIVSGNLRQN